MTCPYCGAENEAGFQFCKTCGAKLAGNAAPQQPQYQVPQQPQYRAPQQPQYQTPQQPQYQTPQQPQYRAPQQPQYRAPQQPQGYAPAAPVTPAAPKKAPLEPIIAKIKAIDFKALAKEPKKLVIPAAAVAAVLVLIILVSVIASSGGQAVSREVNYYMVEIEEGSGEYMLLRNDQIIEEGLEDANMGAASMDGTVAVYVVDGELFVIRGKKSVSITDEYVGYELSQNGAYIAVTDEDDLLTIYNTKNGEGVEVAEDVDTFCLSPNGKNAAYVVDDGDYICYYFNGKESVELGEDLTPLALSDGGKYIYCYDEDKGSLCVVNTKGESEKIASDLYCDYSAFYMNEDHTQLIFRADGKWYATVKGGEKQKLTSDSAFSIILPQNSTFFISIENSVLLYTLPTGDLRNCYVELDDNISYLTKGWELEKTGKDVEQATVSSDGKTLIYLRDNGKLYKVTVGKLDDPVELAEDVYYFGATSDASAVYYVNEDDELMFQKGTKEAKRVGDDVEGFIVTHDDYCLFGSDDTLYGTRNGSKKEKITDELHDLAPLANVVYIWTDYDDGEYNILAATKGIKFKAIYEY